MSDLVEDVARAIGYQGPLTHDVRRRTRAAIRATLLAMHEEAINAKAAMCQTTFVELFAARHYINLTPETDNGIG